MSKVIGYTCVSSKGQLDKNSMEQQKREILDRYSNAIIYSEQFTGTTTDRPILKSIIDQLQGTETLVVCKLDRLGKNTMEGIELVQGLFNKGVAVHVLNVGLLENTIMGKFFLATLLAVAEMERNTIIEQTQNGKAIDKTKQEYEGSRYF